MSRSERAQVLVEMVAALPVCVMCALTIVDCGVIVRDRIAVAQAAGRAAGAQIDGSSDAQAAAIDSLPRSLRDGASVSVSQASVSVRAVSHPRMLGSVGVEVAHASTALVSTSEGAS